MAAPASTTLRITDDRQGWGDVMVAKSRAFQFTVEDARSAPNVVTGSFLVNSISILMLFDLGAT